MPRSARCLHGPHGARLRLLAAAAAALSLALGACVGSSEDSQETSGAAGGTSEPIVVLETPGGDEEPVPADETAAPLITAQPLPRTATSASLPVTAEPPPRTASPPSSRPTSASSRPTAGATTDLRSILDRAALGIQKGVDAFNPPKEMTVGVATKVQYRVSRDTEAAPGEIAEGLDRPEDVESGAVDLSRLVEATLRGGDFEIEPLTPERQVVLDRGFTEWVWQVTPRRSGQATLELGVVAIVELGAERAEKALKTKDVEVAVRVNPWRLHRDPRFTDNILVWSLAFLLLFGAAGVLVERLGVRAGLAPFVRRRARRRLGPALLDELLETLAPWVDEERERRPLLQRAFGMNAPLLDRIDWEGTTEQFALHLVERLVDHGRLDDGRLALSALLEEIGRRSGSDEQARAQALARRLEERR